MRHFAGLKLDRQPEETTIPRSGFPGRAWPWQVLLKDVNKHLGEQGLMLREDSIVDPIIISAPSSTKKHGPA